MARSLLCYLFMLLGSISLLSAQSKEDFYFPTTFAIINDRDGYTNVRDENKKVIDKIYKDEVFAVSLIDEPIDKYQPIVWKLDSENEKTGYIHESRIKYLYDLPLLKRTVNGNSALFENDSIKVIINRGTFDINSKRITKYPESAYPAKIDGYTTWGTDCTSIDGSYPNTEIKSIEYTINGVTRQFEKKDFGGYLFPSFENTFVSIGSDKTLYIAMNNGDGAGAYSLLWVLKNGKVIKKIAYIGF